MKTEVEKIIHKAIDDFNRAWRSHDEAKEGISKYADDIVKLFSQADVSVSFRNDKEHQCWANADFNNKCFVCGKENCR